MRTKIRKDSWMGQLITAYGKLLTAKYEVAVLDKANDIICGALQKVEQLVKNKTFEEEADQILLKRTFKSIGECPFCHGVIFNFDEEALMLGQLCEKERNEIRQKVVDGATLEQLQEQYGDLCTEDYEAWECEKCGHKNDSPKRGGP